MNETIVNEIKEVQRKLKEYQNRWAIDESFEEFLEDYCFPENVTEYTIITSDGIKYIINSLSRNYNYDIDFDKVIYVHKFNGYADVKKNNCWDTELGFYNSYNNLNYHITREDIYTTVNTIGRYKD